MRPSIFLSLPSSPAHPAIYCPIRINVWSPLASLEKGRVYELATHQNHIHLTLLAVNLSQEMDNERRYSNLLSPTLHSIGSNGKNIQWICSLLEALSTNPLAPGVNWAPQTFRLTLLCQIELPSASLKIQISATISNP